MVTLGGISDDENKRLAALARYGILDTAAEAAFDRITELAARIFQAPIAVASFVDCDRQWFKSHFGLSISETPRNISFCTHAILSDQVMVVPDAAKDDRFRQSPMVVGSCRIRFYAGAPLITPEGFRIGAMAIMDTRPRASFTEVESASLVDLASVVMHELNVRQELARVRERSGRPTEGEVKFRALMESASQAIIAVNHKGVIEVVNNKAEELFGYSREELIGEMLEMLLPERLRHQHAGHRKDYFSRPRARPMGIGLDLAGRRKNGQEFPIEISLNYVEVGGESLALSFITDISERIRLEQQLRQSQKMEAVGQLAGGVAHDFNNLLTVIQGYSGMALDGLQPESPLREPLEEIEKAAVSAGNLTRQLLAFSRRQVVRPRVLNLNTVIHQMENMLRRVLGEDIELITAAGKDLDDVQADPGFIEQIIMNLAINARDAMPEGGRLIIETSNLFLDQQYRGAHLAVKRDGPHAMLAVTDTGTGMTPEVQARIFEPFFTTKAQGKGTGLGLATVYGIVEQMEGSIWVYSEPGKGTTFKILLPVVGEAARAEQEEAAAPASLAGAETILLVEDEEGVRKFVRSMLERQGYTILEAADIEAALAAAATEAPIHLLLTDVIMPRMNGPELAERIAQIRPGLKALFMSGYTDRTIRLHDRLDADSSFIQKPFTPSALARKVREVLGGQVQKQKES
jgi:two-component system cell cycle sensor histidine kinase/response regulator CckA